MQRLILGLLAVLLVHSFAWATEELGVVGQQSIDVTRSGGSPTAIYPMVKTADGSLVSLSTLISCEDQTNNLCMVSGGAVRQTTMASAVTTNTTSTAVAVPTGMKTFYGQVVGIGSVTQTQAIYGDIDNDAANGILLCTLTLSGTTRTQDVCVSEAPYTYYYVTTTATTGTSATGAVYAMY